MPAAKDKDIKEFKKEVENESKTHIIKDERFKFVLGLSLIFVAAYLLICFTSYFFTWKADQSFEWQDLFSASSVVVENWAGKLGARIANFFISETFGISSFLFILILIFSGLKLLKIYNLSFGRILRICIIGVILFSVIFGYIFGDTNGFLGSGLGGRHGFFISLWLNAFAGKTGTFFILFIVLIAYLVFSFKQTLPLLKKLISALNLLLKAMFVKNNVEEKPLDKSTEEINNTKKIEDQSIVTSEAKTIEGETYEIEGLEIQDTHSGKTEEIAEMDTDNFVESEAEKEELELITNENTTDNENSDFLPESAQLEDFDPTLELSHYKYPSIDLLEKYTTSESLVSKEELISNKDKIVETLANYKIEITKIKATIGPTVTLYEIVPAPGVRIAKIKNLEDDIALSLSALGIRIIAPIPGKGTIGIEVPNQNPEIVSMRSVISSPKFQESKHDLAIAIGKTISNEVFVFDLAKMPHLLVAGATGQGKSVGLNAIITSLLYKKHPSQIKFVLIDPKKVELTLYSKLEKHFLAKLPDVEEPIITDTQKVIHTLNSLTNEMDERYNLLKAAHVRNIKEYNAKFIKRRLNPEKGHRYMPYIILIIDEFADLIMTAGREVELPLARLAQLARAVGIHLIIATQRPTTNIITGVIKANFPARIAFRVTSMVDSRTILDVPGANQLIGRGDMLISFGSDMIRVQCAFIDTPEIEKIVDFISEQKGYPTCYFLPEYKDENETDSGEVDLRKRDNLFEDAARLVVIHQQGSTSLIQRKFSIGYNRAGRIMDQLEAAGIVGPFEGSKARRVLFADEYALEQYLNQLSEKSFN
jgi:S-DNA-T family DNA segregation ATPase FtsK/SpoIIIE